MTAHEREHLDTWLPFEKAIPGLTASIKAGGHFLTLRKGGRGGVVAWWMVAPSTGLYHAVIHVVPRPERNLRTLCRHTLPLHPIDTHGPFAGLGFTAEDPSQNLMTCEPCSERVRRVKAWAL